MTDLQRQVEHLSAALETAQAQMFSDEEIQHRIEIAVQNATAEMRSRLAQFEGYVSNVIRQGQALLGEAGPTEANPLLTEGVASVNKVAALVKKASVRLNKTEQKIFETLGDLYPDFPAGVNVNQLAVEAGYSPSGGAFSGALASLGKRRLIVRSGGVIRINPELLK